MKGIGTGGTSRFSNKATLMPKQLFSHEVKWTAPVKAGDTIHVVATPKEKRLTKSGDRGIVVPQSPSLIIFAACAADRTLFTIILPFKNGILCFAQSVDL